MNVTTPRYAKTNHFAIRQGKIQDWYAALFQYKIGTDNSYEDYTFGGGPKYCSIPLTVCQGTYSIFVDNAALKRYKLVLVVTESAINNLTWSESDTFTVEDYENAYHYDYVQCDEPWDCGYGQGMLNSIGRVTARGEGAGGWASHTMTYQGEKDKAWFRTLWNAIMVDDQIALTTAAPCEPTQNIFRVYDVNFAELLNTITYSKTGWCEGAPSSSNCPIDTGCSYVYCPNPVWVQIEPWTPITGPTVTWPFKIKHNGSQIGTYPVSGTETVNFYNANSYP